MGTFIKTFRRHSIALLVPLCILTSCKTKHEIQREQELERIKADVRTVRGTRADLEVVAEQLRTDIARMTNYVEEQTLYQRRQTEELRQEIGTLSSKLDTVERKLSSLENERSQESAQAGAPASYDAALRLKDAGKSEDAIEMLRDIVSNRPTSSSETKKARFLLANLQFSAKNYASAALEFSQFRKDYPRDSRVPEAIYKQAQAFRSLGKKKEAKLFYQEVLDKHPRSSFAQKAQSEMKRLK